MTRERFYGYAAAAVGAAAYGLNPLFSLPLYRAGFSPVNALFYRFAIAAVIVGGLYRLRGGRLRPERGEFPALCGAAALMIGSSLTLFYAYNYLDTGIASTLLFVYPVAVAAIMIFGFREKLTWGTGGGIALALAGVLVLTRNDGGGSFSWLGFFLALASALFYSFYIVMVRVSRLGRTAAEKISFYTMLLGAALFLLLSSCGGGLPLPRTWFAAACAVLLALLPTVVAFVLTAQAIHRIGATPASIFGALEPAVAVLCGIIAFHERFTWSIALGVLLVVCSVTLVVLRPGGQKA